MPKKKKSATALFEVMSAGRTLEPIVRSRSFFNSPSLFSIFKRPAKESRPDDSEFPRMHTPEPEPVREVYRPEPVAVEVDDTPRQPREPWLSKFSFKFDLTNSIIAASAVVIVVGLTMLILSKFRGEKVPTMSAVTTADLRKQPPRPAVLDLPRRAVQANPSALLPESAKSSDDQATEKPVSTGPVKRIINMNYLMIQSYQDEKVTQEAADLLNKNGVQCTVIQGLPRWSPSPRWFCVVGTKGFAPRTTETAEFQKYLEKIREVSMEFSGKGKTKWKQFNPQLYRWGADSEK